MLRTLHLQNSITLGTSIFGGVDPPASEGVG